MSKFKDLNDSERRTLLCKCYESDGADPETATSCALTCDNPEVILMDVFGYENNDSIEEGI